ncbi:hypothetical protein KC8_16555 [Sphingomonas sp. KC8]|nr:hypothetical protein KC8_16555 [Sphingomonas sp. KC8]
MTGYPRDAAGQALLSTSHYMDFTAALPITARKLTYAT